MCVYVRACAYAWACVWACVCMLTHNLSLGGFLVSFALQLFILDFYIYLQRYLKPHQEGLTTHHCLVPTTSCLLCVRLCVCASVNLLQSCHDYAH